MLHVITIVSLFYLLVLFVMVWLCCNLFSTLHGMFFATADIYHIQVNVLSEIEVETFL